MAGTKNSPQPGTSPQGKRRAIAVHQAPPRSARAIDLAPAGILAAKVEAEPGYPAQASNPMLVALVRALARQAAADAMAGSLTVDDEAADHAGT